MSNMPKRVDRYDLIGEIASGGMATVFLGRLTGVGGFQRLVAIKRLHPHLANEEEFVEMFLDEARLAAGIHHPNVVPILEVGASHQGYYLVMDYVEGDTLARLLVKSATSKQPFAVGLVSRILIDMLGGLHAAHELKDDQGLPTGLVHRDVSPQNVLVGLDGITRITDFGVARAASRLSATRAGQLKGKVAYMAPEQASPEPQVDRRADVFASGVVLWEALTSKRLFKAENDAATLQRITKLPIPHVSDVRQDVPRAVGDVCMRALDRNPRKRFQDCASLADALERAALASGQLATGRDVARMVEQLAGPNIERHREAVRQWLAQAETSSPSEPRSASRPNVMTAPLPPPRLAPRGEAQDFSMPSSTLVDPMMRHRRSGAIYIVGGLIVALTIVAGAIWATQQRSISGAVVAEPAPGTAPAGAETPAASDPGSAPPGASQASDSEEEASSAIIDPSELPTPEVKGPVRHRGTTSPTRRAPTTSSPTVTKPKATKGGDKSGGFDSIDRGNPYK